MMGRFQHGTILRNAARPLTPAELAGKRIGVRSYSQTTAVWVRGILENDYGVDLSKVRWVTFEDGHADEYREPPGVKRAGANKNLLKMLREGELDAAIYGADLPNDPTLKSLIPDAETAAQTWYARHHVVPINHMVVVTEKLAKSNPQAVKEIYRLLLQAKTAAGLPKAGAIDFLAFGLKACRPALQTIITYALQQRLFREKSRSRSCSTIPPARSTEGTLSTSLPRYLNRVIAGRGRARRLSDCLPNQRSLGVAHSAMPTSLSILGAQHLSL